MFHSNLLHRAAGLDGTVTADPSNAKRAVALPISAWLLLVVAALPATERYDCADLLKRSHEIEQRDEAAAKRKAFWLTNDQASYCAMTLSPLSGGYLARRQPYTFRLAAPLLAHVLVSRGVDFSLAYFVLAAIGLLVSALYLFAVLRFLVASPLVAAAGATIFLLSAKASNPLYMAHEVNPGSWALLYGAIYHLIRGSTVLPASLLGLAVLWHETAVLALPAVAVQMIVDRRNWRAVAGVVLVPLVAFASPRALIAPSNDSVSLLLLGHWAIEQVSSARGVVAVMMEFLHGLGVALGLAVFGVARMVGARLWPMLLLIPAFCGASVGLEIGRLIVPSSLAVVLAAAFAVKQLSPRLRTCICTIMVGGAILVVVLWRYGRWSSWAFLGVQMALIATYLHMRRITLAELARSGG
jgi:hypothetical protein